MNLTIRFRNDSYRGVVYKVQSNEKIGYFWFVVEDLLGEGV